MTSFRPVPLKWHFCLSPGEGAIAVLPLLDSRGRGINPYLLSPARRILEQSSDDEGATEWGRWDTDPTVGDDSNGDRRGRERGSKTRGKKKGYAKKKSGKNLSLRTLDELLGTWGEAGEDGAGDDWHRLPKWKRIPRMEDVVEELRRRAMLPAIWFIFSRRDCDSAAARLYASGVCLTNADGRFTCRVIALILRWSMLCWKIDQ